MQQLWKSITQKDDLVIHQKTQSGGKKHINAAIVIKEFPKKCELVRHQVDASTATQQNSTTGSCANKKMEKDIFLQLLYLKF